MKYKKLILFTISLLSFSLLFTTFVQASDDNNITIEGNAKGLVTIPDKEEFLVKDNMLPGDTVTGTIKLQNNYDSPYIVLIRAEDFENNKDKDFVEKLKLELSLDGEVFYSGNLHGDGENGMSEAVPLGKIKPGESKKIQARVTLDGASTGNEYKNKYASVKWIITAMTDYNNQVIDVPKTTITPASTPTPPTNTKEDNPVIQLISQLKEAVKTSDNAGKFIVIIVLIVSGGIALVSIKKRGGKFGE